MTSNGLNGAGGLRDAIAKSDPVRKELYTSKVWNGVTIEIRALKLGARSRLNRDGYVDGKANQEALYPLLLAESVFDPDTNEPVWTYPADRDVINGLDAAEVDRVAMIALRLAAMTDEEDKEIKKASATSFALAEESTSSLTRSTPSSSSQKHSAKR